jgi:tetratricopeptide (TPR) repeat protein
VDILSYFAWKAYESKKWDEAFARFQTLETALRAAGESGEPLEKAVYIQADCSKCPADYDRFVAEFPNSEFAPRALGEKAQALLVADRFEAAFQTLETLAERYPEASVGKFEAVYLSSGEALLADKKFVMAQRAFSAISPPTAPALYGLAAAQLGQGQFAESFQTLEKLRARFPTSGKVLDARLMQARALRKLDRTDEAIAAYREVLAAKYDVSIAFELVQILPDPEERLAAFQRIALLADPAEEANAPFIANSLLASLSLGLELKKYALVLDTCNQFEKQFPNHEKVPTLGTFRKEASNALAR